MKFNRCFKSEDPLREKARIALELLGVPGTLIEPMIDKNWSKFLEMSDLRPLQMSEKIQVLDLVRERDIDIDD